MDLATSSTLQTIIDCAKEPQPLSELLAMASKLAGQVVDLGDLEAHFASDLVASDPAYISLAMRLSAWDSADVPPWSPTTGRLTAERRSAIYALLALPHSLATLLDTLTTPGGADESHETVISEKFEPWYGPDRAADRPYYWPAYARYLATVRKFSPAALRSLDRATTEVVERLADPAAAAIPARRGLVVGHVQSGKTANFTGVIAKAVDAGYRLVIVLESSLDLLRNQTQRRIDMELVGKEQISLSPEALEAGLRQDYDDDPDWERLYISYGERPSPPRASSIIRLTTAVEDFKSLRQGIAGLAAPPRRPELRLNAPENLMFAPTHLAVVKKNVSRLNKLRADLATLGSATLRQLPVLVIDDESDQASVNTAKPDPNSKEEKDRVATNRAIVELLKLLPCAQYVGYTATPYANVLIDPTDIHDLFPRDFIISLPTPVGYMGAAAFHNLDESLGEAPATDDSEGNTPKRENTHVRNIWNPDLRDAGALLDAIDSFVLAGMIKHFRDPSELGPFRHHTMLLHESHRRPDHEALAALVRETWDSAGYINGEGLNRLRHLYEVDFAPTMRECGLAVKSPSKFEDIYDTSLGEVLSRVTGDGDPVIVVNLDNEAPDFDKKPIWKMIVGGQKLSRGYTIEGLTVSYFRRKARHAEALMQMGRWFGYRPNYRDLVRLYIGRREQDGRHSLDLYELFGAAVRDEESFREQLARYALSSDGSQPIRPIDVEPLVYQSHPELAPVAKPKRQWSELLSKNLGGEYIESGRATTVRSDQLHNLRLFEALFQENPFSPASLGVATDSRKAAMEAVVSHITATEFIALLEDIRWPKATGGFGVELAYLRGDPHLKAGDPGIDGWFVIAPQQKGSGTGQPWKVGGQLLTVQQRARVGESKQYFNVFSGSSERGIATALVNIPDKYGDVAKATTPMAKEIQETPRHGVCLLYPTRPKGGPVSAIVTPGIAFALPPNGHPKELVFRASTDLLIRTITAAK